MAIESLIIEITGQFFQHHFADTYALVQAFYVGDNITFIFHFIEPQNATLKVE